MALASVWTQRWALFVLNTHLMTRTRRDFILEQVTEISVLSFISSFAINSIAYLKRPCFGFFLNRSIIVSSLALKPSGVLSLYTRQLFSVKQTRALAILIYFVTTKQKRTTSTVWSSYALLFCLCIDYGRSPSNQIDNGVQFTLNRIISSCFPFTVHCLLHSMFCLGVWLLSKPQGKLAICHGRKSSFVCGWGCLWLSNCVFNDHSFH